MSVVLQVPDPPGQATLAGCETQSKLVPTKKPPTNPVTSHIPAGRDFDYQASDKGQPMAQIAQINDGNYTQIV